MTNHHDLGEQIITAGLTGRLDPDLAETLLELHLLVTRNLTCRVTGQVLDSRTAHLLTVTDPDGTTTTKTVVAPDAETGVITARLATVDLRLTDRFDPTDAWASLTDPTATNGEARS